jgi:hypothetical protein
MMLEADEAPGIAIRAAEKLEAGGTRSCKYATQLRFGIGPVDTP